MPGSTQTVGIIGIGRLGMPIAINLLKAGFGVVGFRRTNTVEFTQHGGRALYSPQQVAREADVLVLCLPGEEASTQVLDGSDGILNAIKRNQIVIETGTYSSTFKKAAAGKMIAKGARVLEAEISGAPPMVVAHTAALYIGGDQSLYDECKPILKAISPTLYHLGEFGSAVSMKLIANYLLAIHTLAAAEAMNLGAKVGFDPKLVAEVIQKGAGGSAMFAIRAPLMAERKFNAGPGSFGTLEKYLRLGREMADELGCATPLFSVTESYFHRGLADGLAEEDIAAVLKYVESDSVSGNR